MAFLHKYNRDDIHLRAVVAGLVNLLNNKIFYYNVLTDSEVDVVQVPFYFSFTGDERYLQDHFLQWNDCQSDKFSDGNYDKVPRGIVTFEGKDIDESALTQRFIRGTYTREIDGKLETFSANLNPLPLSFNFNVEIVTDTLTDNAKIDQTILEIFYKTQVFNVEFKGFMLPCTVAFPSSMTTEKTFEYSYPDSDNKFKLTFSLQLDTYYPVTDALGVVPENSKYFSEVERESHGIKTGVDYYSKGTVPGPLYNELNDPNNSSRNAVLSNALTTERHIGNKMETIPMNIEETEIDKEQNTIIKPTKYTFEFIHLSNVFYTNDPHFIQPIGSPPNEEYILKSPIYFGWNNNVFVHKVDIMYCLEDDQATWFFITKGLHNDFRFMWDPYSDERLKIKRKELNIIDETGTDAKIYGFIDTNGGALTDIVIENPGQNYSNNTIIEAEHNYSEENSQRYEAELSPVISNGQIIDVDILDVGSGYTSDEPLKLAFKIKSTANPEIEKIYVDDNDKIIFFTLF